MRALGDQAKVPGRVYLTGGATAVLMGWRASTIDVDLKLVPEDDALLRAIPALKESLHVNVELAAPSDFIPPLPGWEQRSAFVVQEGKLSFHHYDLYAQALSKLERAHARDLADVRALLSRKLIDPEQLEAFFVAIEPRLYQYPAISPRRFREQVMQLVKG